MTVTDLLTNQADEFKQQGNKFFSAQEFEKAVEMFSKAIELDPSNHVLYSNRSASYSSLKNYDAALKDAAKTVELKPDWAKGYSRVGAAHHGLGQLEEAADAYKNGLKIEPENALLKKGLEDVNTQMEQEMGNPMANMFGADMWQKLASNPKLSPFLAQPDVVSMLQECQKDPNNMSKFMQDQRMMQIMLGLMGLDGAMAASPEELAKAKQDANDNLDARANANPTPAKKPEPAPEPVEEVSDEAKEKLNARKASDDFKQQGNELYKKRKFTEALEFYDKAWGADATNVAVLTNKAAVLFEMENYEETIKVCEQAVESGREIRADFKLIGRYIHILQ